ncbi:MAG: UDP-N-acetylmuramoyl-tripeptide--D-alanyl-D-alanine ligase [Candidatus Ratteibacteria bacterium]|nr:UDP-N-acetylmuramoyl-tripeptide--D-alanyl-D-alanine ligase [Candidatus Ratteibacteria bacterium]
MAFMLSEILKWTDGELLNSTESLLSFKHVGIDSRKTEKGELFIAVRGKRFDGHDFLMSAFSKGAKGAVVSRLPEGSSRYFGSDKFVLIKVKDTIAALQDISTHYRRKFKLKVVAVTGSNGKTTTKDLLAHILQRKFSVLKSTGNFNNQIGLPLSLCRIKEKHQAAVLELGMSSRGEIKLLSELSRPQFGIITNVSPAHLQFLGSLENAAKAKAELIEFLGKDDIAILNNDDPYVRQMKNKVKGEIVTFGIKEKSDFQAQDINCGNFSHLTFKINGQIKIFLSLLGRHNIYNALAACAAARRLGLSWDDIECALADFSAPPMRMEFKQAGGFNIINDAYNANPQSMRAAIESLLNLRTRGKKILVLGDMLELGDFSANAHRQLGEEAGKSGIDYLLTVGNFSRLTARGAVRSGMASNRIFHSGSLEEVLSILRNIAGREDIVLIKGSRAMQLERIIERN